MASAKPSGKNSRIYLTKYKTHQKWLALVNQQRNAENLEPYLEKHKFVIEMNLALKKCEVTHAEWVELQKFRKSIAGENEFVDICIRAGFHKRQSFREKVKIVEVCQERAKKKPCKVKVVKPEEKRPQKQPEQQLLQHQPKHLPEVPIVYLSAMKTMLIPFLSSLYSTGTLDSDVYPADDLLRDNVLNKMAQTCHRQWTSQVGKISLLPKLTIAKTHY